MNMNDFDFEDKGQWDEVPIVFANDISTSDNPIEPSKEDLNNENESIAKEIFSDSDDEILAKLKCTTTNESSNTKSEHKKKKKEHKLKKIRNKSLRIKRKEKKHILTNGTVLSNGTFIPDRESQEKEIEELKISLEVAQSKLGRLEAEVGEIYDKYLNILNSDQIKFVSKKIICKWSPETILKCFKLFSTCGPEGYAEMKRQGFPIPSINTLEVITNNIDDGD